MFEQSQHEYLQAGFSPREWAEMLWLARLVEASQEYEVHKEEPASKLKEMRDRDDPPYPSQRRSPQQKRLP